MLAPGGGPLVGAKEKRLPERTAFVGRRQERDRLLGEIRAGSRLLTLAGPSGIGKTSLARRVLADLRGSLPTAFCSAQGCTSSAELRTAVAGALGVSPKREADLAAILAARGPILLVLDNLDDVADGCAILGEWIDEAPALQILGTSIVPLDVEGVVAFELRPLEPADAVQLYRERAHRAWADRTFSAAEQQAIDELVGRLDGIPLAIELAAARVRVLPPLAMLARIESRFEILASEKRGRHGSLVRALSVTWELLSPEERRLLARASIFENGFTLETASIFGEDEASILPCLDGLRAKALLQVDDAAEPRFSLYESVRAFAAMELERSGDAEATAQLHADHFLCEGEIHARRVDGPAAPASIRWLKAERSNLTAIVRRYADRSPAVAARAGLALSPLLALEGPPTSEAELLDATLGAARAAGDPQLLAQALRSRATAILQHGRSDEALADLREGLAVARRAGLSGLESHLLVDVGAVLRRMGEPDRATSELELAIRISREVGEPIAEALALLYLGDLERSHHSLDRATAAYEQSLALLRRQGHLRREWIVLLNLAVVRSGQGRFREARACLADVLEIAQRLESGVFEADALVNLGGVELAAGALDAAKKASLRALELQRALGNRRFEALALANLGIIALERGEDESAGELLRQAIRISEQSAERRFVAAVLPFLAIAEARRGQVEEARRCLAEAAGTLQAAGDDKGLAVTDLGLAFADLAQAKHLAAGGERQQAAALEHRARERLAVAAVLAGETTDCIFTVIRLLEQELARAFTRQPGTAQPAEGVLVVGPGATFFEIGGGDRVDLRRRGNLRRMLEALVERRLETPGACLAPDALFAIGWEGETIHPEAETARVYTAIWNLRSLGLAEAIVRQSEGYLIDPRLLVVRAL